MKTDQEYAAAAAELARKTAAVTKKLEALNKGASPMPATTTTETTTNATQQAQAQATQDAAENFTGNYNVLKKESHEYARTYCEAFEAATDPETPAPAPRQATNVHLIAVKFHGPTNNKGSRISLTSQRFKGNRVTLSYDYEARGMTDQAQKWLTANGFTVLFFAEGAQNVDFIAVREFQELPKAN